MTRKPSFDELIDAETTGAERERLRKAHELLLEAGPPPELTPRLQKAPTFDEPSGVTRLHPRRIVKRRALLLVAAAVSVAAIFAAGYGLGNRGGGSTRKSVGVVRTVSLQGTSALRHAEGKLVVWHSQSGNWPMTLSVVGLPKLPPHGSYEVYLVRDGKPWGSCGSFRVKNPSQPLTVTLNAPYSLKTGDSWVVTRPTPGGGEPGKTVLSPVAA